MSSLKRLKYEIHHRSLWQVVLIYVGGALVLSSHDPLRDHPRFQTLLGKSE